MNKGNLRFKTAIQRIGTPWHLWLIGLFFIFVYANGIYDYFMMFGYNEAYYSTKNYGANVFEYFTDYPTVPLIFWTLNVFCGLIAPILLLIRSRWAVQTSLISAISIFALELTTFAFMDRWHVLGPWISFFDIGILVMTVGLFIYCSLMKRRGVLR
ncbi:hypothetical protein DFP94_106139 [Fontibacillus phaseoli]|uniref:Uncharacterized protein n=1 Tax=Fontibacillus phaseoli TaxID=1416533 RepID=A0A369BB86_9BACL|nr:hypothetical protein [Fontibacillus phaseoli]RCX18605.1 hypothetical protein DFP94_106139 [Fontibacillus phaseoli]